MGTFNACAIRTWFYGPRDVAEHVGRVDPFVPRRHVHLQLPALKTNLDDVL